MLVATNREVLDGLDWRIREAEAPQRPLSSPYHGAAARAEKPELEREPFPRRVSCRRRRNSLARRRRYSGSTR